MRSSICFAHKLEYERIAHYQHLLCIVVCFFTSDLLWSYASAGIVSPASQVLRIESGMHTGMIHRIGVDQKCDWMVTASFDKTVRLWRVPELNFGGQQGTGGVPAKPKLARIFRPPVNPINPQDNQGKAYATAISPNGLFVAAGGWFISATPDTWSMYVYAADTGDVVFAVDELPSQVLHLTYSQNGRYLAATLHKDGGLYVWDTESWAILYRDDSYSAASYGAAFGDDDERLYTVSEDGYLRSYDLSADLIQKTERKVVSEGMPYQIAVNPESDVIAVGYLNTPRVDLFDMPEFTQLTSPSTYNLTGGVSKIAWSSDGETLFAGGSSKVGEENIIRIWSDPEDEPGQFRDRGVSRDTISHLLPCGDGVAFSTRDPSFGVLSVQGRLVLRQDAVGAGIRSMKPRDFSVSADGNRVGFLVKGNEAVIFNVDSLTLESAGVGDRALISPDRDSISLAAWEGKEWGTDGGPSVNGTVLGRGVDLEDRMDEVFRSFSVVPNRRQIVVGSEWRLRLYNSSDVTKPIWEQEVPSGVVAVNAATQSGIGVVLAAFKDGAIRWYRLSDGQLLLSLYVDAQSKQWIVWTQTGYFESSSLDAEELMGWHVNRGRNGNSDFFPVVRFRDQFHRPDIITTILRRMNEERAIMRANTIAGLARGEEDVVVQGLPPVVTIISPRDGDAITWSTVKVQYQVRLPPDQDLERVYAVVDGVHASEGSFLRLDTSRNDQGEQVVVGHLYNIKVPSRDFELSVVVETSDQTGVSEFLDLDRVGQEETSPREPPFLRALLIGIGDYEFKEWDIRDDETKREFISGDVEKLEAQLWSQNGRAFTVGSIVTLVNHEATAENILNEITLLVNAKPRGRDDVTLLFFSGHGVSFRNASILAAWGYNHRLETTTGIWKNDLLEKLGTVRGRKLLILDACYAKSDFVDVRGLATDAALPSRRIITLGSSDFAERSYGDSRGSYFTRSLLEAMRGLDSKMFSEYDAAVTVDEIEEWAVDRVKDLVDETKQGDIRREQTPFLLVPQGIRGFDLELAIVDTQ